MVKVYCYINFGIFSHDEDANIEKALQDIVIEKKHKLQTCMLLLVQRRGACAYLFVYVCAVV